MKECIVDCRKQDVTVITNDVLTINKNDWETLASEVKPEAILCWLYGTYPQDWQKHGFSKPDKHREALVKSIQDTISCCFQNKITFNVVDRCGLGKEQNVNDLQGRIEVDFKLFYKPFTPLQNGIAVGSGSVDITALNNLAPHFVSKFKQKNSNNLTQKHTALEWLRSLISR